MEEQILKQSWESEMKMLRFTLGVTEGGGLVSISVEGCWGRGLEEEQWRDLWMQKKMTLG